MYLCLQTTNSKERERKKKKNADQICKAGVYQERCCKVEVTLEDWPTEEGAGEDAGHRKEIWERVDVFP
jgi:hypothetical protein